MAILIEENRKNVNWFALIVVLAVLIIVGTAVFYLFFVNPSSVDVIIPENLKIIGDVGKVDLNQSILNPGNLNLKLQVPVLNPEPASNFNPFAH